MLKEMENKLTELRKYVPLITQSYTDDEDEAWDARRLVLELATHAETFPYSSSGYACGSVSVPGAG